MLAGETMEQTQEHGIEQDGGISEKLNRSCEACRGRKIRCIRSSASGEKCSRCEKLNLTCTYLAPNTRKRHRRTAAKVAELERELHQLKQRVDGAGEDGRNISPPFPREDDMRDSTSGQDQVEQLQRNRSAPPASLTTTSWTDVNIDDLDDSTQQYLLDHFAHQQLQHLPFIDPSGMSSVSIMRENRPALFGAILAASAASSNPSLAQGLAIKLDKLYAERVMIEGEKSLDLVQSLILTAVFYHPPFRFSALKFTQYAHMATNMALDLCLGSRKRFIASKNPDLEPGEGYRACLACYILCSRYVECMLSYLEVLSDERQHGPGSKKAVNAIVLGMDRDVLSGTTIKQGAQ